MSSPYSPISKFAAVSSDDDETSDLAAFEAKRLQHQGAASVSSTRSSQLSSTSDESEDESEASSTTDAIVASLLTQEKKRITFPISDNETAHTSSSVEKSLENTTVSSSGIPENITNVNLQNGSGFYGSHNSVPDHTASLIHEQQRCASEPILRSDVTQQSSASVAVDASLSSTQTETIRQDETVSLQPGVQPDAKHSQSPHDEPARGKVAPGRPAAQVNDVSMETIDISAPTVCISERTTHINDSNVDAPTRAEKIKASQDWVSSRQTALDRLRAELECPPPQKRTPKPLHNPPRDVKETPSPAPSSSNKYEDCGATPESRYGTTRTHNNISTLSGITPDRHPELHSRIVEEGSEFWRSPPSQQKSVARGNQESTPSGKKQKTDTIDNTPSKSPLRFGDISDEHVNHSTIDLRNVKQSTPQKEVGQKQMQRHAFHPSLSPGASAMKRNTSVHNKRGASQVKASPKPSITKVHERLYPPHLQAASAEKARTEQKALAHHIAREEMILMRKHLRAAYMEAGGAANHQKNDFSVSISNILGAYGNSRVLESTYRSPMACAMMDWPVKGAPYDADSSDRSAQDLPFHEFLSRQNAHYTNRSRVVQHIIDETTPSFQPSTTAASGRMLKAMLQRSMLNSSAGPDTSSILQERRRNHVPVGEQVASKHKSPYVDPCTFSPKVSRVAAQLRNNNNEGTGIKTFEHLYSHHKRQITMREAAKRKAEMEETEPFPFKPTLNHKRNANVESFLKGDNYERYEKYMRKKRELQQETSRDHAIQAEKEEMEMCTFRPKTSKTPAYIAKMAASFGVVRTMDYEF